SLLRIQPVADLDHQYVVRAEVDEAAGVAAEVEAADAARGIGAEGLELLVAALLPDEEEGGAGAVLPAQHRVAAQRVDVEVAVLHAEGGRGAGSVGVDGVSPLGVAGAGTGVDAEAVELEGAGRAELHQRAVVAAGEEGLGEELEAERR